MLDVTVVILTKNEEVNLPDCLESVKDFATRCVVIDSGSIDKTKEIAAKFSADFTSIRLRTMLASLIGH